MHRADLAGPRPANQSSVFAKCRTTRLVRRPGPLLPLAVDARARPGRALASRAGWWVEPAPDSRGPDKRIREQPWTLAQPDLDRPAAHRAAGRSRSAARTVNIRAFRDDSTCERNRRTADRRPATRRAARARARPAGRPFGPGTARAERRSPDCWTSLCELPNLHRIQ